MAEREGSRGFLVGGGMTGGALAGAPPTIRIDPEEQLALRMGREQLKGSKEQRKRQNQLFEMLLGGGQGGLIGGLFGSLTGGGGMSQPGFREGGGGPAMGGQPGFQEGGYGSGQRAALQEQFRVAQNNMLGSLEARGLGGSSLVGPGLSSVARQQSLASGELEDRLFREQLQFRAAERAPLFGLLGQLLGSVGV